MSDIRLEIDGGVTPETAPLVAAAVLKSRSSDRKS